MGEVNGDYDGRLYIAGEEEEDDEKVHEWELGLPNFADIAPLTQGLIPIELLSAFNIKPEPYRTSGEVTQASEDTLSILCGANYKDFCEENNDDESGTKKQRRTDSPEDADSAAAEVAADAAMCGGGGEKAVKRSRLVWTPQLHKRFVDVVGHLGIKNAVPKTIMQLMNVEGLTRENVASHLQKYRLYLKRMRGDSIDGGSNSSSENGNGKSGLVPVMGMGMTGMENYNGFEQNQNNQNYSHNQNHSNSNNHYNYNQFSNGGNGMMMQSGSKYGSMVYYHQSPTVGPGNN